MLNLVIDSLFLKSFAISFILILIFLVKIVSNTRKLPPGPWGIPIFGYSPFLQNESHKSFCKMREKYGNLISVKLGTKLVVVVNEFKTLSEVLCHPSALDRSPGIFDHMQNSGFIAANGQEWVEQRRFCMRSLRDLGLGKRSWEELTQEEVSTFTKFLHSKQGKPTDTTTALISALSNSILTILMGQKLQKDRSDHNLNLMIDFTNVSLTYTGPSYVTSLMPRTRKVLEQLGILGFDKAAKVISSFSSFVSGEIKKLGGEVQQGDDRITSLLDLYQDKAVELSKRRMQHYFSDDNLEGAVKMFFLGGTDTIYSSLGWLFRLMAKYTAIQEKVQQELNEVIGRERRIQYDERFSVPYTFAVMMEAQRWSSIVPLNTTRRASADFEVRGYTIPKGTDIIGNLWCLHNDPDYWREPNKFIPERFLDKNEKCIMNPPSFLPFSIGRRNCPGETVAWMTILSFFTAVMQDFVISVPEGTEVRFDVVNGLVSHLKVQDLCFTARTETIS